MSKRRYPTLTPDQLALFDQWRGLVISKVNSLVRVTPGLLAWCERQDLDQVGLLALARAAIAYDPSKGFAFGSLAGRSIVNALRQEVIAYKQRHVPAQQLASEGDVLDRSHTVVWYDDLDGLLAHVAPHNRRLVRLRYADGLTLKQIGRRVGLTDERIRQRLNIALAALRARLPAAD